MFLFRRRKENSGNADELRLEEIEKLEKSAKAAKPAKAAGKDKKEKTVKKPDEKSGTKDPFFQSEDALQIIENDAPVKVVIPASKLAELDSEEELEAPSPEPGKEPVPEEIVDGMFEKVNQEDQLQDDDVALDAILPSADKKETAKPAGSAPAPVAEEKPQPAATTQPPSPAKNKPASASTPAGAPAPLPEAAQTPAPAAAQPAANKPEAAAQAKGDKTDAVKLPGAANEKAPTPEGEKAKKEGGEENKDNLFSQLFGKTEEAEETPLDRLIKSLPEITMEEVMDEAEEVKGLMSEWFESRPKK